MGDRCAYQHSTYITDENWRRRTCERQQQHTNLYVDELGFEQEDDSSESGRSTNGASDSSCDSNEVRAPTGHRTLMRFRLTDRRRSMSDNSTDGGIFGVALHDAHHFAPPDSEAKSDTEDVSSNDSYEDEGVHFYGAPGRFRAQESSSKVADWRFAVASAIELEERRCDDEAPIVHAQEKPCDSEPSSQPREICRFFLSGNCKRDVQCLYAHPVEAVEELFTEQADDEPSPPDCGICLEAVTDRFGILTGCDHAFCLKCLGKWRKKGKEGLGIQLGAVRGCPLCRKPSFFIIPSLTFVKGKKKHQLIETYKDNLAQIPCRNFKSKDPDSCPFGNSCFFLHRGPKVWICPYLTKFAVCY